MGNGEEMPVTALTAAYESKLDSFKPATSLLPYMSKQKRKELWLKRTAGYISLEHRPGEGQADFGTAGFYKNGRRHHEAKYLVISFPYRNSGFLQDMYGRIILKIIREVSNV